METVIIQPLYAGHNRLVSLCRLTTNPNYMAPAWRNTCVYNIHVRNMLTESNTIKYM